MVEEAKGEKRKTQDEIRPSDLRPQAQFYELVRARNPKTGEEAHFLYWWNKGKKEVTIEEVDAGGMRVEDTSLVKREVDFPKSTRRIIADDINTQREKGLKIARHQRLNRELFEKGRTKKGALVPFYDEMVRTSRDNLTEAKWDYDEAKRRIEEKKESEKLGNVYRRKSVVGGPSSEDYLEKRKHDFETAIDEFYPDLRFYNQYLNEMIGLDEADNDNFYSRYVKHNEELSDLHTQIRKSRPLEEKYDLVKKYEDIFLKRLEVHHKLAEERGYLPVKEIPEELPIGGKPKEKKKEVPIEEKPEVDEEADETEEKKPEKIKTQLEPKTEAKEIPVKVEEPKALKEEVEDIGEALSASAKGLKEKGSYTFSLKGGGTEELVGGIIPRFKEVWEQKGIKIIDYSIDADIKPDAGKIEMDVKVKKGFFSKRIQATLKLESKDGVLNITQVSANPKIIDAVITSYNVQEMIEENIGGEKIHSIINEWLAFEMDTRGAKLENVEFRFTPEDTLQVKLQGGEK